LIEKKLLIERILETENLTDELQDADAQWLLDWGINQLDPVLQGVSGEDEANERLTALMGALRKINRLASSRDSKNSDALAADLTALASLIAQAFGRAPDASLSGSISGATQLRQGTTRQALEFLTAWGLQAGGQS
jgi:hypothetical protein